MYRCNFISIFIPLLIFALGCSGDRNFSDPIVPDTPLASVKQVSRELSSHRLKGFSFLNIDTISGEIDIIPARSAEIHMNLTGIFNGSMGLGAAGVPGESNLAAGLLVMDISMTHPFSTLSQFSGFDVKGILITPGSLAIGPLTFADPAMGETMLLNTDGYTRWWNPSEFTSSGIMGYTPGVLAKGSPATLTATVNPYKYFADILGPEATLAYLTDEPLTNDEGRGVFRAGSVNTRRYRIQFEMDPGPQIVYGYAIDCSWAAPSVNPPAQVPDDFPINANQPEAYRMSVIPQLNTLYHDTESGVGGGLLTVRVNVYDWQGQNSGDIVSQIGQVRIYSPDLFSGGLDVPFSNVNATRAQYEINLTGTAIPSHAGQILLAAKARSSDGSTYQQGPAPAPDVAIDAWQAITLNIPNPDCAGDANNDFGEAVTIDLEEAVADQVCLPDDYRDFYAFTIPAVYAVSGSIDFYCDAQPTTIGIYQDGEGLLYEEAVTGGMASITVDEVNLFPGDYLIRVYTSNNTQVSPYYLDMNLALADQTPSPVEITPDELFCDGSRSFIHDNYLIITGYDGLWIYDISDTSDPDLVYFMDEMITDVAFQWPYIYYADYISSPDNYDISLIDLSTITSPEFHHSVIEILRDIKSLIMNSEFLFVMYESLGVNYTIDIYDWATEPTSPAELYSAPHGLKEEYWTGFTLVNPETADPRLIMWSGIFIDMFDVEPDGSDIIYLDSHAAGQDIHNITSQYSYFYVISQDLGIGTFDICRVQGSVINGYGTVGTSTSPYSIAISGDYAYVGCRNLIDVIDISDIGAPAVETSLPTDNYTPCIDISGSLMAAVESYCGFNLYSLTYPQLPSLLYNAPVLNSPKEIEIFDNYALVADDDYNTYHGLKVLDISDPANAHVVEELSMGNSIMYMEYYKDTAYLNVGWDLAVVDCSDPLDLSVINFIDLAVNIAYYGLNNDTLYLGTWDADIQIYDVTDPSAPVYKNNVDTDGNAIGFAFRGNYMYITTSNDLIQIFSISNPWNPASQGTYTPGTPSEWLISQENYLYATGENSLEILNINNPTSPVYEGSVLGGTYDKFRYFAIDGLYAYLGGAHVTNCTPMICSLWPPDSPQNIYTFDPYTYGSPYDMEVQYGILYMASGDGIRIYQLY